MICHMWNIRCVLYSLIFSPENLLRICFNIFVFRSEAEKSISNDGSKYFRQYKLKGDWPEALWVSCVTFFVRWYHDPRFPYIRKWLCYLGCQRRTGYLLKSDKTDLIEGTRWRWRFHFHDCLCEFRVSSDFKFFHPRRTSKTFMLVFQF